MVGDKNFQHLKFLPLLGHPTEQNGLDQNYSGRVCCLRTLNVVPSITLFQHKFSFLPEKQQISKMLALYQQKLSFMKLFVSAQNKNSTKKI